MVIRRQIKVRYSGRCVPMKKVTLFSSLLVAGALTFTGISGTAQADEQEGAKTVWGEVLPAEADPDGDGWANTGFDPTWMSPEGQNRIAGLGDSKDNGDLSQVEYNEAVAEIFKIEQARQMNDPHEYVEDMDMEFTEENLARLALNSPEKLDAAPLKNEPYNYNFVYASYEFHFSYDGTYWSWSYESVAEELDPLTDEELIFLVHNDPAVLNERPVKAGEYDFKLSDDDYVYHFTSNGEQWKWSYEDK